MLSEIFLLTNTFFYYLLYSFKEVSFEKEKSFTILNNYPNRAPTKDGTNPKRPSTPFSLAPNLV